MALLRPTLDTFSPLKDGVQSIRPPPPHRNDIIIVIILSGCIDSNAQITAWLSDFGEKKWASGLMWAPGPQSGHLLCKGSHTSCTLHDKNILSFVPICAIRSNKLMYYTVVYSAMP